MTETARDIATEIGAKQGKSNRFTHLSSIRFWLAVGAENPAPDGQAYRIRRYRRGVDHRTRDQIMLEVYHRTMKGWYAAREFKLGRFNPEKKGN